MRAKQASLSEIISAVESAAHIKIDLTGSSLRQFTGIYSGSLRKVLSRLLYATDHVIKPIGDGLSVRIVSAGEARPVRAMDHPEDAALNDLAAAAARGGGSRAARIRQQRAIMNPVSNQDQQ